MTEHDQRLKQFDEKLAELEKAIKQVQEQRREYINQNGLNKTNDAGYTVGDRSDIPKVSATKNSDGKWHALGKFFKRKGQCERYILSKGFRVGQPVDESWITL